MKTSIITFKREREELDGTLFSKILSTVSGGVLEIDTVSVLNFEDELALSRRIEEARTYAENLVILIPFGEGLKVKKAVCEKLNLELLPNENALAVLKEVSKAKNFEVEEKDWLLPDGATLIPNFIGVLQGFMIEDSGFTLVAIPFELEELSTACEGYVLPYFNTKSSLKPERWQFKFFGERKNLISILLSVQKKFDDCFKYYVDTKGGDSLVSVVFLDGIESAIKADVKREIVLGLNGGLYADFNTTLSERLFHLLKLRKIKLSVAESFTGGRIVSALIENSGISEFLMEGVVTYSNQSKVKRLGVKEEDVIKLGAVSSKVAYEMAAGLLTGGNCDMAIATTGIAGPKSEDTVKPVGLSFIAVGDKNGVHVYKYNFTGNREEITETAKNTALFLAIKKLINY